jgi:hypothetical protein
MQIITKIKVVMSPPGLILEERPRTSVAQLRPVRAVGPTRQEVASSGSGSLVRGVKRRVL